MPTLQNLQATLSKATTRSHTTTAIPRLLAKNLENLTYSKNEKIRKLINLTFSVMIKTKFDHQRDSLLRIHVNSNSRISITAIFDINV